MKKIFFAALLVSGFTSAFATSGNDNVKNISKTATTSFKSSFEQASNVSWSETNRFNIATFTMNNQIKYAYYNLEGVYLGTIHNLSTTELPKSLSVSLKKLMGNSWVSELFELSNDQETTYYVRLDNGDGSRVLRSTDGLNWETYNVSLPQTKM